MNNARGHAIVALRELSVGHGSHQLVDKVNLDFYPGEIHLVLGESGAGKTLCLRAIAGLASFFPELTFSGGLTIDGTMVPLAGTAPRADLACLLQDGLSHFNPVLSMLAHVREVLGANMGRRLTNSETIGWLTQTVKELGLGIEPGQWSKLPREFSGGMLQRAQLVLALGRKPRILLADEPFSALDPANAAAAFEQFRKLAHSGISIVLVSHEVPLIEKSDRVTVLYAGRKLETFVPLAASGTGPRHPYTLALLSSRPGLAPSGRRYPPLGPMVEPADRGDFCPLVGWCPLEFAPCRRTMPTFSEGIACHGVEMERSSHV